MSKEDKSFINIIYNINEEDKEYGEINISSLKDFRPPINFSHFDYPKFYYIKFIYLALNL